jgi:putative GTP pyrophosphokinase
MASIDINEKVDRFYKFYADDYKILETASEYFRTLINSILLEEVEVQNVLSRVKYRDECISKFKRKYQKKLEDEKIDYEIKNHITDLIGVRVICLYEPDIAKIKKLLEDNFEVIEITDKIKDIDSTENQFGYKSLHLDLRLDMKRKSLPENKKYSDLQFEVQVRTIIQDAWSVLDHKIKYKKNIPSELKRRINRLAALFELADDEFFLIKDNTEEFEKESKAIIDNPDEQLNIFSFLDVVIPTFPNYNFIIYKADNFVHEILEVNPQLTRANFEKSIRDNFDRVKKYNSDQVFQSPSFNLNPYTMIRHCLYLFDREKFKSILFDIQRESFDSWILIQD